MEARSPGLHISPKRIFLSYGHDDLVKIANRIKTDLMARGHEVWFDLDRINAGDDWEHYIENGLDWASHGDGGCVLLLMTPYSVRRPDGFCLNELARAIQKSMKIVPVMLVWCEPPLSLCRIQWLDMTDVLPVEERRDRYEAKFNVLVDAVEKGKLDFEGFQSKLIDVLKPLSYDAEIRYNLDRFTGREWVFNEIDRWLASERSRIFWIAGNPGVGKTAIAAWLCTYRREIAAFHFCRYDNVQKMDPRRCVMSIAYQLSTQLPDYEERLKYLKLDSVGNLNAKTLFDQLITQPLSGIPRPDRKIVMLIDALDEATANGRNELASFIASEFERTPDWLALIVTSRPDPEVMGTLQAYTPFMFDISDPRNEQDIRAYLAKELKRYHSGKEVPAASIEAIMEKCEGLFLYAKWIVKELDQGRLSLERLDEFPQGLGGIYLKFFERQFPDIRAWESEVRPVLEVISALQEPLELKVLYSIFKWSVHDERRFRRSLGSLFLFDRGLVNPFHKSVMEWLTNENKHDPYFVSAAEGHKLLADHGWGRYKRGEGSWTPYLLAYLPIHLCMAGRMEELEEALGDIKFIKAAWDKDKFNVLKQWTLIEERSTLTMASVYRPIIENPGGEGDKDLLFLANLLENTYHFDDALKIADYLVAHYSRIGGLQGLQEAIGIQARIYHLKCDYDKAMKLYKEQERICRETGNTAGLQYSIRSQANILSYKNEFDAAMALYREQERICRETGNKNGLMESLIDQCFILRFKGDYDAALVLISEQERISREIGNKIGLQVCFNERGVTLLAKGDLNTALSIFKEQEKLCSEIGNKDYLRGALTGQEMILRMKGDLDRALALNEKGEMICRKIGSKYGLQECLGDRAISLRLRGDLDGAMALIDERECICKELDNKFGLGKCHGERGLVLLAKGDLDAAMARLKEQENICREISHRRDLAMSLDGQAAVLRLKGDLKGALALHGEAVKMLREMGFKYGLQEALGNQAMTLHARGDLEGAVALLKEQEKMCREMCAKLDLQKCLENQKIVMGENVKVMKKEGSGDPITG